MNKGKPKYQIGEQVSTTRFVAPVPSGSRGFVVEVRAGAWSTRYGVQIDGSLFWLDEDALEPTMLAGMVSE